MLINNLEMGVKKVFYEKEGLKGKVKENTSNYSESTRPEVGR
jgi:hypothetical protein